MLYGEWYPRATLVAINYLLHHYRLEEEGRFTILEELFHENKGLLAKVQWFKAPEELDPYAFGRKEGKRLSREHRDLNTVGVKEVVSEWLKLHILAVYSEHRGEQGETGKGRV